MIKHLKKNLSQQNQEIKFIHKVVNVRVQIIDVFQGIVIVLNQVWNVVLFASAKIVQIIKYFLVDNKYKNIINKKHQEKNINYISKPLQMLKNILIFLILIRLRK